MKTVAFQLVAITLLFITPVSLHLSRSDVVDHMETLSLLSSQEAWLRYHAGERHSWLIPTMAGQLRIRKPPMLPWITGLAWTGLTPQTSTIRECVWRARVVGALLTLMAIFSTYALAHLWGGRTLAWLSGLILATMVTILEAGRLAAYDTHLFAWTTLSVSAGAWLMARGEGWTRLGRIVVALLSGVALSLAALTKGPIALLFVGAPLLVMAFHYTDSRRAFRATTMGVILAPAILCLLAWSVYVVVVFSDSSRVLLTEYRAAHEKNQPFWYYVSVGAWILPWTFSFLGAVLLFRLRKTIRLERSARIALLWFGLTLLIMSLHEAKRQRYLVPIMPAAAILAAYWWQLLDRRALPQPWISRFRSAHTSLLGVGLLILPLTVPLYPLFLRSHLVTQPLPESLPTGAIIAATLGLLVLTWAIWKSLASAPLRACALTGLWMSVVFSVVVTLYIGSGNSSYTDRSAAEQLGRCVTTPRLHFLQTTLDNSDGPNNRFIFYSRKILQPVTWDTLRSTLRMEPSVWLLARPSTPAGQRLEALGFTFAGTFEDKKTYWDLFHRGTTEWESEPGSPREAADAGSPAQRVVLPDRN